MINNNKKTFNLQFTLFIQLTNQLTNQDYENSLNEFPFLNQTNNKSTTKNPQDLNSKQAHRESLGMFIFRGITLSVLDRGPVVLKIINTHTNKHEKGPWGAAGLSCCSVASPAGAPMERRWRWPDWRFWLVFCWRDRGWPHTSSGVRRNTSVLWPPVRRSWRRSSPERCPVSNTAN